MRERIKKRFKIRIAPLLLSAALLVSVCSVYAAEAETPAVTAFASTASGTCGTNVTWTLSSNGTLTIKGSGKMVTGGSSSKQTSPWSSYKDKIKKVVIKSGVTSIGYWAFYNCDNLTSVTIPSSVTRIYDRAFSNCSNLQNVTLPSGLQYIDAYAFWDCESITKVTIPDSVLEIGDSSYGYCDSLTNVVIGKKVKSIGDSAFFYDRSLTTVSFAKCTKLTEISDSAFAYDTVLENVTLPDSLVTIGSSAFYYCEAFTEVDIPDQVTTIGDYSFRECASLEDVTIGSSVTYIGKSAFRACESLTGLTIPASVTTIEQAFIYESSSCRKIIFLGDAPGIDEIAFSENSVWAYYPADNATWTEDVRADYGGSITWIAADAAGNAYSAVVQSGTCGSDLTWTLNADGTLTIEGTGEGRSYSSELAVPWYSYRWYITDVVIGDGVTGLSSYAFTDCFNLENISLGSTFAGIEAEMFDGCSSLKNIEVSSENESYTCVDGVLFDKAAETLILYPCGLTASSYTVPSGTTTIGSYAFSDNTSLSSVALADTVTAIGENAFDGCTALASVQTASGNTSYSSADGVLFNKAQTELLIYPAAKTGSSYTVPSGVTAIESYAFNGNGNIESITLSDSVADVGDYAFYYCTALNTVVFGTGTGSVGNYIFTGCGSLERVVFEGDAPECARYTFYLVTADVYYHSSSGGWTDSYMTSLNVYSTMLTFLDIDNLTLTAANTVVTLSKTSYTCSGTARKPSVTVTTTVSGKERTLTRGQDYTVSYQNNKQIGKATVTVTGTGYYSGTLSASFTIKPARVTVKSVKSSASKKAVVKWKKITGSATKYQIRYRVKGKSKWKTVTVKGSAAKKTLKKLKSGKKYQVQVRAYKTVSGKKYYGQWSKTKVVKVK